MTSKDHLRYFLACAIVALAPVCAAAQLLPPPQIVVKIAAGEVAGTPLHIGFEYVLYVVGSSAGYRSLIADEQGITVYRDVPTYTKECHDSSLPWPDHTVAHVMRDMPDRRKLVVYAGRLNPCLLLLDLDLGVPYSPGRPGADMPEPSGAP